jgi:MoxR-like ATPase
VSEASVARLRQEVTGVLKQRFVGRDEVIDLIALAVVSGEHLFLHGPPGTAKSALIRQFAQGVQGRYFEYMLTRFTEPNEVFGPIDLVRLREGKVTTVTTGMLPEAEFVFLDELFNANSAILNTLLTVLNERVYRRGAEVHQLPMLSFFSAANHLPEDEALQALFDRFLLRCHVSQLSRETMPDLLAAGWILERTTQFDSSVSAADLRELAQEIYAIDLSPVTEIYAETVLKVRDLGIAFSDRRAVKVMKLLAASALLCGRRRANVSDLWVLRYVWDREEQIDPLAVLVNGILKQCPNGEARHALAAVPEHVDPEELARQIEALEKNLEGHDISVAARARLRERLAGLVDQIAWVSEEESRKYLLDRTKEIQEQLE